MKKGNGTVFSYPLIMDFQWLPVHIQPTSCIVKDPRTLRNYVILLKLLQVSHTGAGQQFFSNSVHRTHATPYNTALGSSVK